MSSDWKATRRLLGGFFQLSDFGEHDLKGFAEPIRAWRVVAEARAEGRFEALHAEKPLAPLVGREHELGLLLDRFRRASEGVGQVVLLSGEAGIGKSRLVRALHERLTGMSYSIISQYCSPHSTNTPFAPMIGFLEHAAFIERRDPRGLRLDKIEALLPEMKPAKQDAAALIAMLLSIPADDRYSRPDALPASPELARRWPDTIPRILRVGLARESERYRGERLAAIGRHRPHASDHAALVIDFPVL